jgi:hypothetical protein
MFRYFYFVRSHKIANNSTTTEAREKIIIHIESLEFYNLDKSAASFCSQMAPWATNMFLNFYLVKNCKIANNSTTTAARE